MDQIVTATSGPRFRLVLNDWWKGLILATLTTPITLLYTSLQAGTFTINWQQEGMMALIGFLGYILKNFLNKPQTTITLSSGTAPMGQTLTVQIPKPGETIKKDIPDGKSL